MLAAAHAHAPGAGPGFVTLTLIWLGMMTVMMAPTAWPWVWAFRRFDARERTWRRAAATTAFSAGYLTAWLFYSVVAAVLQWLLLRAGVVDGEGIGSAVGPSLLVAAGLFQFAPLKRACLVHCRNPLTFFLSRWRDGSGGGYRMGLGHGLYCVGCCWALMATMLAVGVMNAWWMAALTLAAFVEQAAPSGNRLRVPLGLGLLTAGLLRLVPILG